MRNNEEFAVEEDTKDFRLNISSEHKLWLLTSQWRVGVPELKNNRESASSNSHFPSTIHLRDVMTTSQREKYS